MKKLLLILLLAPALGYGQLNNFYKNSNNEVYWAKVYNENLDLPDCTLQLKCKRKRMVIYVRDMFSAEMTVQHKDGKTRLLCRKIISLSARGTNMENANDLSDIALDSDGNFKNQFSSTSMFVNEMIEAAIDGKIEELSW
jgi:hypothetical protein